MIVGFQDEYDKWLNSFLETENPLSEIVLELSLCESDINKTISVLARYRMEQPIDEAAVCDRLRIFLKNAYYSSRMNKEEVVYAMYTMASHIGAPWIYDLKTFGPNNSTELISTMSSIISVSKFTAPFIFVVSIIFVFIWLFMI